MFGFFEDDKEENPYTKMDKESLEKVTARNKQTIRGLQSLVQRVTGQASSDQGDTGAQRRFLARLRKEGGGL